MNGTTIVRIVIGTVGLLMLLGGLVLALSGGGPLVVPAVVLLAMGVLLVVVAVLEVTRYRSETAEDAHFQPGPGGGETVMPDPRFRRTGEVFVDPTTHRRMRVFADPISGERRYVAED